MGPGSVSAFTRVFDALWAGTTEILGAEATQLAELHRNLAGRRRHVPGLEHAVEGPACQLAAGRKPYAVLLHVLDDAAQGLGPAGPAGNVGMELERAVSRKDLGFLVELVEH